MSAEKFGGLEKENEMLRHEVMLTKQKMAKS